MIKKSLGGFRHPTILFWASIVVGGFGGLCFGIGWRVFGVFLIFIGVLLVMGDLRVRGHL